ncbi:MAG: hypothetical protein L0Z70_05235 [Chloroflexi bacterium]|nr:hypothetical protein [Chloroflexota bacterium]
MSSQKQPAADEVLSVIRYLGQQHAAVELTKSFRGMVVQQDVNVLEVNHTDAAFRVTSLEMCATLEGDVYLHNRLFPKPVMAHVKSLDMAKGTLVLYDFVYDDADWKQRQHERVRPKHPTYVTLRCKRKAARACLENMSVNGMGALAFGMLEKGVSIQSGVNVLLDFELPPNQKFTALKGNLVYLHRAGRSAVTMGIRLFPKAKESRVLEGYVAQRKQEIFEELNQSYWEISRPRGVESLYF